MSSAETLDWTLGARSETGYVRTENEDRMGWTRTSCGNVYVVSDGMGGHRGGALAAEITVRTLRERLAALGAGDADAEVEAQLGAAFAAANEAVHGQRDAVDPQTCEMGATAVALVTAGARILVGHVGDSRAYLWRRSDGLRRLTRDHTRVQKMLDAGLITPAQAAAHPDASVLDRAIGHRPHVEADVGAWIALVPGDMVLLCSDGLCGYVDDGEIDAVLRTGGDPQVLADRLVERALREGGEDNVTVQLVRFGGAAAGGAAHALRRPLVLMLVPLAAALSGAIAWAVATRVVGPVAARLASVQARLDALEKAPVAVPAAAEARPAASAAAPAASARASASAAPSASAPARPAQARPAARTDAPERTAPPQRKPQPQPVPTDANVPADEPARAAEGAAGSAGEPSRP